MSHLPGASASRSWCEGLSCRALTLRRAQMNDASAICVSCFKAGGHEEHDYVLYRSESGGCCDCGDVASWEPAGCCPLHRPSAAADGALASALPPATSAAAQAVLALAFERLALALEALSAAEVAEEAPTADAVRRLDTALREEEAAAAALVAWLQRVCAAAALRPPATAVLLAGSAPPALGEPPAAQLAALERRTEAVGSPAQAALRAALDVQQPAALLRTSSPELMQRRAWPLLDRLLSARALQALSEPLLDSITTLLLLLLYERPFKEFFTHALLRHYRELVGSELAGDPAQAQRVSHCLDRITVQLWNAPEATWRLARDHRLLDCLLGLLCDQVAPADADKTDAEAAGPATAATAAAAAAATLALGRGADDGDEPCRAPLAFDMERPVADGRVYSRVLGDLRMVLAHPIISLHLFARRPALLAQLLSSLAALQGAGAEARRRGNHVERESGAWLNAVSLEVSLLALWAAMVEAAAETAPLPQPQPAPTPPDAAVQALARAGAAALSAAGAWAAAHDAALEAAAGMPFSLDLHPASVHLPLHRAGALALAAVLQGAPREVGGPAAALAAVRSAAAAAPGGLCGLMRHPARVRAWSSAVRARLWVRNGSTVARLEHVYGSAFWAETGAEADALLMQLCLAATQSPAEADALAETLFADTTMPLLVAAVEAGGPLPAEAEDDAWLLRSRDALRLAVQLCRERGALSGSPPEARLRRAVVHWLALEDTTHTALCNALPAAAASSPALDAVLAQVAHFVAPGGAPERAGLYTLRTAAWAEFDPAFAGYTVAEREAAMARAAQLAQPPWRPAAALRPPPGLSAPLSSICLFARSPTVLRVCRACLRLAAQQPGVSSADDLCLEAMQLLALASADATAAALDGTGAGEVGMLATALAACDGGGASILQLVSVAAVAAASGSASPVSSAVSETAAALLSDLRARGLAPPAPPAPLARTPSGSTSLADAAAAAREERRRAMRERQRAVLAAMQAQQRAFAAANDSDDDKEDDSDEERPDRRDVRMAAESESDASSADVSDDEAEEEPEEEGGCALCLGDAAADADTEESGDGGGGCLAWVALAQPSSVPAAASRAQPPGWRWAQLDGGRGAMSEADPRDAAPGVHVAACGHRVHAACLSRYVAALRASYTAGRHFPGEYVLSVAAGQFLCPVCRRLANGVLPVLPRAVPTAAIDDDNEDEEAAEDADEAGATLAACAAAPTATLGAAALAAICAAAQSAVTPRAVEPRTVPASFLPQKRSASQEEEDGIAPLRPVSLGSAGRSGSLGGSRMLRRRSSAAAAAAAAASADAEADRFAERCRTLLGAPPPQRDAGPAAVLWAVVAYNVTHWETASRPLAPPAVEMAAAPAERTPHWRALQAMCRMALRASGAPPPSGFSRPSFDHHRAQQQGAAASGGDIALHVDAASALMGWLAGGPGLEPGSMVLGALATRSDPTSASMQHMAGAEPAGADLYRLLLADTQAERGDALPAVVEAASSVTTVDVDTPRVGRLLATGDGFGLFCELAAAATAAHNAALIAAHGSAGAGSLASLPPAWDVSRVRALARLAASVAVAHAAADVGATAAGSAMQVAPVEALQAVADVACGADAAAAAPLLAAVASRSAAALRRCAVLAALLLEAAPPALPSADAAEALRALRLPPLPTLLAALADGAAVGTPALSRWLAPAVPPEPRTPPTVAGGGREALRAWLAGAPAAVPAPPLRAPTLLQLPELYQDLFLELSDRPCVACRRVPDEPALCLSCGRLVCCAGACCALSHGGRRECSTHAAACGAGTAFYLLVRTTKLLLLRGSRRCLYPSPYLDAHGEEDLNLRRGRPLFLNAERYAHVRRLWATAGADADTHCLHTSRAGAEHY